MAKKKASEKQAKNSQPKGRDLSGGARGGDPEAQPDSQPAEPPIIERNAT